MLVRGVEDIHVVQEQAALLRIAMLVAFRSIANLAHTYP